MTDSHWGYIALAYGVTVLAISITTLKIVLEHRRLQSELAELERDSGSGR
jgi:heme exporter protein CcmD